MESLSLSESRPDEDEVGLDAEGSFDAVVRSNELVHPWSGNGCRETHLIRSMQPGIQIRHP